MKLVFQSKLPPRTVAGNCLAACFATILDLPLDEVPNVEVLEEAPGNLWFHVLTEWLRLHQLQLEIVAELAALHQRRLTPDQQLVVLDAYRNCPYIAQGLVGDELHVAVYANGRLVHDPTPTGAGLDTFDCVWVLRRLTAEGWPDLLLHDNHITYSTVPQAPDY